MNFLNCLVYVVLFPCLLLLTKAKPGNLKPTKHPKPPTTTPTTVSETQTFNRVVGSLNPASNSASKASSSIQSSSTRSYGLSSGVPDGNVSESVGTTTYTTYFTLPEHTAHPSSSTNSYEATVKTGPRSSTVESGSAGFTGPTISSSDPFNIDTGYGTTTAVTESTAGSSTVFTGHLATDTSLSSSTGSTDESDSIGSTGPTISSSEPFNIDTGLGPSTDSPVVSESTTGSPMVFTGHIATYTSHSSSTGSTVENESTGTTDSIIGSSDYFSIDLSHGSSTSTHAWENYSGSTTHSGRTDSTSLGTSLQDDTITSSSLSTPSGDITFDLPGKTSDKNSSAQNVTENASNMTEAMVTMPNGEYTENETSVAVTRPATTPVSHTFSSSTSWTIITGWPVETTEVIASTSDNGPNKDWSSLNGTSFGDLTNNTKSQDSFNSTGQHNVTVTYTSETTEPVTTLDPVWNTTYISTARILSINMETSLVSVVFIRLAYLYN